MSKRVITLAITGAVLLQITVLAVEYLGAVYPLWSGQEVRLKTEPVDPRSLFRGNYARLNYGISTIPGAGLSESVAGVRAGEVVYVTLKATEGGLFQYGTASLEMPGNGLFIRGRITSPGWGREVSSYNVNYGIEAYFAPKEKALALEKTLGSGAIAVVMVADNGRAALKAIEAIKESMPE